MYRRGPTLSILDDRAWSKILKCRKKATFRAIFDEENYQDRWRLEGESIH